MAVEEVPLYTVRARVSELAAILSRVRRRPTALVLDALTDNDLDQIARAILLAEIPIICGSAALTMHLDLGASSARELICADVQKLGCSISGPTLVVAGSLHPVTTEQVRMLSHRLGSPPTMVTVTADVDQLSRDLATSLLDHRTAILTTARTRGSGPEGIERSEMLGTLMGEVVRRADHRVRISSLVVVGGRTSYHVCRALHMATLEMVGVALPEMPLLRSVTAPTRVLGLKPGGFGSPETLIQTIESFRPTGKEATMPRYGKAREPKAQGNELSTAPHAKGQPATKRYEENQA